jgi:hypothetical protein
MHGKNKIKNIYASTWFSGYHGEKILPNEITGIYIIFSNLKSLEIF